MPPRARMRMDDGPINMPMLAAVVVTTTVVVSLIVSYLVSLGGGPMPTGRTARLQGATGSAVQPWPRLRYQCARCHGHIRRD